jgi:hypothetical protein
MSGVIARPRVVLDICLLRGFQGNCLSPQFVFQPAELRVIEDDIIIEKKRSDKPDAIAFFLAALHP